MEAQKIIITGGATRIGAAIAEQLSGFKIQIVIQYNMSRAKGELLKKKLEKKGSKIYLIKADLRKEKDVKKIVKFAKTKMGYLDCLINNASVFDNDKIENFNSKSWNNHLDANLKAPAILSKEFSKHVKKGNNNITSHHLKTYRAGLALGFQLMHAPDDICILRAQIFNIKY